MALLPMHLVARLAEAYKRSYGINSVVITMMGAAVRYCVRHGLIERSIPLDPKAAGRNLGNYSLRLTPKGMELRKQLRIYHCQECLNSRPTKGTSHGVMCQHCGSHRVTFSEF